MKFFTAAALESGVPYIAICTVWGPGSKDQTAIDAYNAGVRTWAASLGDRCILIDQGPKYTAAPATYFTPSESPQVHWSVTGQDTFVADIVTALSPYLASDYSAFPISESAFTYKSEAGILFSSQFATFMFPGDARSTSQLTSTEQIVANGTITTSPAGTISTATAASSLCAGNRCTFSLTSGALGYTQWQVKALEALAAAPTIGDRIAFACGFEVNGFTPGTSMLTSRFYFHTDSTTSAGTIVTPIAQMATTAYAGVRGLLYFEFNALAAYTFFSPKFIIEQADNLANLTAGAYAGSITLDNPTLVNLTTLARATNY